MPILPFKVPGTPLGDSEWYGGTSYEVVNVTWTGVTSSITANGNSLLSDTPITLLWVHSARSQEVIGDGGAVEFNLGVNKKVMAGLNNENTTDSYTDLSYAFYHYNDGGVWIYENGDLKTEVMISQNNETRFRIELNDGVAKYFVKEPDSESFTLVYTSGLAVDPETDYFVDTAFYDFAAEINNVQLISPG